jgi:hypothetical protein
MTDVGNRTMTEETQSDESLLVYVQDALKTASEPKNEPVALTEVKSDSTLLQKSFVQKEVSTLHRKHWSFNCDVFGLALVINKFIHVRSD